MATVKSGINKVGNNYYQSITQDNPDGSVGTTLYRVDAQGNNGVPIYDVDKSAGSSEIVKSFDPNATAEEQRLLSDPNSQLSKVRSQQVLQSNPYRDPTPIDQSTLSQAGGGSGNEAAIDPNQPNTPGGSTPANPNTPTDQQTNKPVAQILTYPSDMSGKQDRIKFTAVEYLATGTFERYGLGTNDPGTLKRKNRVNVRQGTSVFLAIQSSITDNNSVDWQGGNLNEIERRLANASLTYMNMPGKQVVEQVTKDVASVVGTVAGYSKEIKVALAGEAVGIQNILGRFGTVLNPNLELLFTGPQLRPFTFTFKMSPRSGPEAKEVKDIINFFKKNMAPTIASGNIFLKAPKTFFIKYEYGENRDGEHPGLNLIKECALTNCSVDYTPNGTYMTYPDGTMVSYSISLQFQELEPIYSGDYKNDQSIGF